MVNVNLGQKIKELRKKKGYTLEKLGQLTDSSKGYIWELENKNPPRPSGQKLSRIAEHLGTTIEYLLDETGTIDESNQISEKGQNSKEDLVFFRNYKSLKEDDQKKVRGIIDAWKKEGEDE